MMATLPLIILLVLFVIGFPIGFALMLCVVPYADCFVRSGLLAGASTDQTAGGYISGASTPSAAVLPDDLHADQGKG